MNDVVHFKDHLIVDSSNCLKQLLSTEFYLDVELWFTESNYIPSNQDQIRLMFRRQLKLHFNVCQVSVLLILLFFLNFINWFKIK